MNNKILFLTTHNLATNPRLVKEIRLALQHNYRVEVICYIFRNWSYKMNTVLIKDLESQNVVFHCLEAGREKLLPWFISVGKEKLNRRLAKISSLENSSLANAVSRRSHGLVNAISKVQSADWVIGHNPGALWATIKAGERFRCKTGFDVEDYHPGEGHDKYSQDLTKKLMHEVLPRMDYVSFASPLIRDAVKKDLGEEGKNWMTVLNYFSASEFVPPLKVEGVAKWVWFSQNIAACRGLEFLLPYVKDRFGEVELHLFGNINNDFYEAELKGVNNVILHKPLPQKVLHASLNEFDIGLALEIASDINRELCITNKMLAYMQSGLFVLATDTPAQQNYLNEYPLHGKVFNSENTGVVLDNILKKTEEIRAHKLARFEFFKEINLEKEGSALVKVWSKTGM